MRTFQRLLTAALFCSLWALAGCAIKRTVGSATRPAPIAPAPIAPAPITPKTDPKFVYTGNQGGSLSGFSVKNFSGVLRPLKGFPFSTSANPTVVAADPKNRFLFVGDVAFSQLRVFTINSRTGALSEIRTSPYATVNEPVAIAVDPSGSHLYVASQGSNLVEGFEVDAKGALKPIAGSPFPTSGTGDYGDDVVINASGTFVYVQDHANIYTYSISASSGALTLVQTIAGPGGLGTVALDPRGKFLYAVGSSNNSILVFSVNAFTGLLTLAASSPMVEKDGAFTISIAPNGKSAYTIENNNDLVSYALIKGVFTPIGSVYSRIYGQRIGIDPKGKFLYVPQACGNCSSQVHDVVHEFSIGRTGVLKKIAGSPVNAGVTPWGIAFTTR